MLVLLVVFLVSFATAQVDRQTGVIRGVVNDSEGAPLPGVNVTARSSALMGTVSDTTNMSGAFRLVSLPPGTYSFTAELEGFKKVTRENVIVRVGMTVTVNLTLEQATVSEEVTVVAPSPAVDVRSTKISNVMSEEIIQKLPLNRSFTSILSMVPGANGDITTYSGSIHGARPTTLPYEIDGVNVNDPAHQGPMIQPQYDTMEEVKVIIGGISAQVGNTGGSFVNIIIKSGGNEFHGRVNFYYTREDMTGILYTDSELNNFGIAKLASPVYDCNAGALKEVVILEVIY